jgi:tRNA(Glu) U13 pseudouridine synthase TruD
LCWEFASDSLLNLSFCLPAGSYATVLLREIAVCQQKE